MKRFFAFARILTVAFLAGGIWGSVTADDATPAQSAETKSVDANSTEPKEVSGDATKIATVIPFAQTTDVRDSVRTECDLGGKLSGFILEYGADRKLDIAQSADLANEQGKVLNVEITGVQGAGGGAWSGPKTVQIKGTLTENGKEIGSFRGSRVSGGGAFGGFKNTCAIFGRCVKALGKDVAEWLKAPTANASLGDG